MALLNSTLMVSSSREAAWMKRIKFAAFLEMRFSMVSYPINRAFCQVQLTLQREKCLWWILKLLGPHIRTRKGKQEKKSPTALTGFLHSEFSMRISVFKLIIVNISD